MPSTLFPSPSPSPDCDTGGLHRPQTPSWHLSSPPTLCSSISHSPQSHGSLLSKDTLPVHFPTTPFLSARPTPHPRSFVLSFTLPCPQHLPSAQAALQPWSTLSPPHTGFQNLPPPLLEIPSWVSGLSHAVTLNRPRNSRCPFVLRILPAGASRCRGQTTHTARLGWSLP